ncbi:FmdB family zinc ribbon protein [Fodinisporobacter ferrooxydans]|uniref:FmdB family zinc ribbon protein n=1 Tax=Fodinisporobacter ferrooxydans TaxID=2901836 RepID=UPI003D318EE5
MPRIHFICKSCGEIFVEFVKFEDRDKLTCPACGSKEIKQDFSGKWNGSVYGGSSQNKPKSSGFT